MGGFVHINRLLLWKYPSNQAKLRHGYFGDNRDISDASSNRNIQKLQKTQMSWRRGFAAIFLPHRTHRRHSKHEICCISIAMSPITS